MIESTSVETNIDRQKNELLALKSIFDGLHNHRNNKSTKEWQPLDISITLTPQRGMSWPSPIHVKLELHVICGLEYPDEVPQIKIENSEGLSNEKIALLVSELEELAKKHRGEVMIFELAQHVRQFLCLHNKPGIDSFYDEMLRTREKRIQNEREEQQLKQAEERLVIQNEIERYRAAMRAEHRTRKGSIRQMMDSENSLSQESQTQTSSIRMCLSSFNSFGISKCEHRGTQIILFDNNKKRREVERGICLGHDSKGSVVYCGIDKTTGELLAIREWTLHWASKDNLSVVNNTNSLEECLKFITTIEQEINHLQKLQHRNLLRYLNMEYVNKENYLVIYILQEFIVGSTCSIFLTNGTPVGTEMLRHLAAETLSALNYLHDMNVVHKDIRDSSIHIDRFGAVKLSDYSVNRKFFDFYRTTCSSTDDAQLLMLDFPEIQGRSGKKKDIYRFGILILSLLKGYVVSEKELASASILQDIQMNLRDFLSKCLMKDERSRWSASQLLEHSFIRMPLKKNIPTHHYPKEVCIEEEEDSDSGEYIEAIPYYRSTVKGQSRVQRDFVVLKFLGKGAFGDVIKVKNKLDGGYYAIKRIKLNPKKQQLYRKMTREVKLLSRLNHDNVVRYYTSWIESAIIDDHVPSIDSTHQDTFSNFHSKKETPITVNEFKRIQVENSKLPINVISHNEMEENSGNSQVNVDDDDDLSDVSDEDWAFVRLSKEESSSDDGIEFEKVDSPTNTEFHSDNNESETRVMMPKDNSSLIREIQFMYIQMEFCEKSTLRIAIDKGLYQDEVRVWRLFREIAEGLNHIHRKGMIHRDLKPVNIFLDKNDHVKIGDFGLATANDLLSRTEIIDTYRNSKEKGTNDEQDYEGSLTGQVGTALYTAPELNTKTGKAIYNQKVDIYSLGIIFFEMCYRPLKTGMEREKVLAGVRSEKIILPDDITGENMPNQVYLIKWLLNHDPSLRPTTQELLSSDCIPTPELEEVELQEMVKYTLSNKKSKTYKDMVACWFSQRFTTAEDVIFDMNFSSKGGLQKSVPSKNNTFLQENIKSKILKIFMKHGGISVTTPILIPKSVNLQDLTKNSVKLMTNSGSIVSLPYDLRVPFIRYVVWNEIINIRRYAIERVFRDKKGLHPRELYECAFDIISPIPKNFMEEAEIISIVWEIVNEITELREKNFTVRLNHTSILQAVLLSSGIDRQNYNDIYSILCEARQGKISKFQMQTHLTSLCLTDQAIDTLFKLLEAENSIEKIGNFLKSLRKKKNEAGFLAEEALEQLEILIANVTALKVEWPMIIVPLLVHNIEQYNGIIYQIVTDGVKVRQRKGIENVIAAGGRYDKLLMSFGQVQNCIPEVNRELHQYGVGISISLDKLISIVNELKINQESQVINHKSMIDVLVSCVGLTSTNRDKKLAQVLRELWTMELSVTCLNFSTIDEVWNYCTENIIDNIVILKEEDDEYLLLRIWDKDRFQEKKLTITDLSNYFRQQTAEITCSSNLNRSESKTNTLNELSSNCPFNVNINFVLSDGDKISGSGRRSFKNAIITHLSSFLHKLSHKTSVEVFAVFLDMTVIRSIATFIEIDEEENTYNKSIQAVVDMFPRYKWNIKRICEEVGEIRNEKNRPAIVLYSLIDRRYVTLI